jgi:hypothetical protein
MLHLSLQNWTHFTSMVIAYQNKKHTFNWLNTRHVTFTIPWWLGCRYWPVQKPWIDWWYRSISAYKIAVPIRFRFLDSLKNFCALYCVCQILVFNAINTIVTDMEGNIRIERQPLGRGTDRETDISLDSGSGNIMSTAICISWYCLPYQ